MEVLKHLQCSVRQLALRMGMLGTVVLVGGFAIAQLQRDRQNQQTSATPSPETATEKQAGKGKPSAKDESWQSLANPITDSARRMGNPALPADALDSGTGGPAEPGHTSSPTIVALSDGPSSDWPPLPADDSFSEPGNSPSTASAATSSQATKIGQQTGDPGDPGDPDELWGPDFGQVADQGESYEADEGAAFPAQYVAPAAAQESAPQATLGALKAGTRPNPIRSNSATTAQANAAGGPPPLLPVPGEDAEPLDTAGEDDSPGTGNLDSTVQQDPPPTAPQWPPLSEAPLAPGDAALGEADLSSESAAAPPNAAALPRSMAAIAADENLGGGMAEDPLSGQAEPDIAGALDSSASDAASRAIADDPVPWPTAGSAADSDIDTAPNAAPPTSSPVPPAEGQGDLNSRGLLGGGQPRMLRTQPNEMEVDGVPQTGSLESVGTGRPGPEDLDGPQSAAVVIHKKAPAELRFGQPAVLEIVVRNVGQVAAEGVVVEDAVPEGTKLVRTNPEAEVVGGRVRWTLGSIAPGQEVTVTEELVAVREGMVGSVATVTFQASAATRSRATRPLLELKHTGPQTVLAGQPVKFSIELTNPGSGAATNVVLQEDVPEGLKHTAGTELEYEVGTIPPGGTRRLELTLSAARPGPVVNLLRARADGGLEVEDRVELDVVAPQLAVALEGPEKRYLERKATYELTVANPGTADANNVELLCRLPEGLRFVSTNNAGLYDPNTRSIRWSLARLPAREMGKVQFTVIPHAIGQVAIQADAMADRGLSDKAEKTIEVQGIAALFFGLVDLTDPIEVNGQTRYEIHVVNQGTKAATNIQLVALVPPGMRPVAGDGQTSATIEGQQLVFEPLDQLPPKGEAKFYITVDGMQPGDHRVAVRLTSDEIEEPVTKEESTRVYSDQ